MKNRDAPQDCDPTILPLPPAEFFVIIHIVGARASGRVRLALQRGMNRMTELDKKLAKAARECSADAVRRTFEAGLPITIIVGNRVIRRWPDGREELVEELPPR